MQSVDVNAEVGYGTGYPQEAFVTAMVEKWNAHLINKLLSYQLLAIGMLAKLSGEIHS